MSITARRPEGARSAPSGSPLDRLLDEVLLEHGGDALLGRLRALADEVARWRTGEDADVAAHVAVLPSEEIGPLVRACTMKLALAHLSDEHRGHARGPAAGVGDTAALLRSARHPPPLDVRLVLTAHPTDISRRSVLTKQRTISSCLQALDDPRLGDAERRRLEDEIREALAIWLATNEVRSLRPRVADEVRRLLFFFETVLFEAAGELASELAAELGSRSPVAGSPAPSPWLTFGSWAGGDMDGNPEVGAATILETLRAHRALALTLLLERIVSLRQTFSQSERAAAPTAALRRSLLEDERELPETAALLAHRYPHEAGEPLRRKLAFVAARLEDDLAHARGEHARGCGYRIPERLLEDLEAIRESAGSRFVSRGRIDRLIWQVRTFGFHLMTLELRENAPELQTACRALLPGYAAARDERERAAFLEAACLDKPPPRDGLAQPRAAAAMDCVARAHDAFGRRSLDTFIVSNTEAPSDLLCALWLARRSGVQAGLDLVPLFERGEALQRATDTMAALYASRAYARQLHERNGSQQLMLGYSDAAKDVGHLGSRWLIYRAQERLSAQAQAHGVSLRLFHGRGGSPARGGGPAHSTIAAEPPGTVKGHLKVTEQGEVITAKFRGHRVAVRSLAQTLAAVARASVDPGREPPARWRETMARIADVACSSYRALVYGHPDFPALFRGATPIDALGELNLGSRPCARGDQRRIEELRAIPWVFAWTQSRAGLPGWYGSGEALQVAPLRLLREMYRGWPFFAAVLASLERAVAIADLRIADAYLRLARAPAPLVQAIVADYERCVAALRAITGRDPVPDPIAPREPWLDALGFLQVELLARVRAGDNSAREPLLGTIAGIATGLRTTG